MADYLDEMRAVQVRFAVGSGSRSPRRAWLGSRERIGQGEPAWRPMRAAEVEQLVGAGEVEQP